MRLFNLFTAISVLSALTKALRYSPDQVGFNLNENQTATDPLDYWGEWPDHVYQPSPANWRMPMYTFFIDRFVNGYVNHRIPRMIMQMAHNSNTTFYPIRYEPAEMSKDFKIPWITYKGWA
ncbi:MAG: hypothetical protein Q9198_011323, partial [Flavoplaca austrocitrina]